MIVSVIRLDLDPAKIDPWRYGLAVQISPVPGEDLFPRFPGGRHAVPLAKQTSAQIVKRDRQWSFLQNLQLREAHREFIIDTVAVGRED